MHCFHSNMYVLYLYIPRYLSTWYRMYYIQAGWLIPPRLIEIKRVRPQLGKKRMSCRDKKKFHGPTKQNNEFWLKEIMSLTASWLWMRDGNRHSRWSSQELPARHYQVTRPARQASSQPLPRSKPRSRPLGPRGGIMSFWARPCLVNWFMYEPMKVDPTRLSCLNTDRCTLFHGRTAASTTQSMQPGI